MINFIVALLLLIGALGLITIRKTYYSTPIKELKRRAKNHDSEAAQLYKAVAYGGSLEILLWLAIGVVSGLGIVLLTRIAPFGLSFIAVALLLWVSFSLIPESRTGRLGIRLTKFVTPAIAWLLHSLHPLLRRLAQSAGKTAAVSHTGLFERADLLELIELQLHQGDNRVTAEELGIAYQALSFSDYLVQDIMLLPGEVTTVTAGDIIGPIMIDELHRCQQSIVPVTATKTADHPSFVGMLRTHSLGLQSNGPVNQLMDRAVYYLHEDDNLSEALRAFTTTNCRLFIVIDDRQRYVGVLTVEALFEQLLGHIPGNDLEEYSDPQTIAARHQLTADQAIDSSADEKNPDEIPAEVIE